MGTMNMDFGVVFSIDCPNDEELATYLPRAEVLKKLQETEKDDGEGEYEYLGGSWVGGHHTKYAGILKKKEFEMLVEDLCLRADTTETMGIMGAPWTESGMGWSPAMNFEALGAGPAIFSVYVSPLPLSTKEVTEELWEQLRAEVLEKYGDHR